MLGAIEIDNAAALRIFAGFAHGARAQKAVGLEPGASSSISTRLPGAAENVSAAMRARGGTRCNRQSTVVATTRGRSREDFERARRASAVMRREAIGGVGRDAVIGLAVPAGQIEDFEKGAQKRSASRNAPNAARRARHARRRRLALGVGGQRARQIGGDEGVEALGSVGEEEIFAGLQSREGGF